MSTSIKEYYRDKVILVTGGTGFIGKVLVEKLTRSCPGIKKIYLLMRAKKGQAASERLEAFKKDIVFQTINETCPEMLDRFEVLPSELTEDKLGLSPDNVKLLCNVNVVFHCAASVRFDEPIRDALMKNTKGTYEMLELAMKMPKLEAFVHVSTTYCVAENPVVEEKVYPPTFDWKRAIKLCEKMSEDELNAISYKFSNNMPNTYVFTKALAEAAINDYKEKLPLVILRPSIVVGAEEDPMPGYVENFNGPMGILVATAVGVLRTQWFPTIGELNGIPADLCCKGIILAAYKRAQLDSELLPVYNAASVKLLNYLDMIKLGRKHVIKQFPPEQMVWRPGGRLTTCLFEFYIRLIFTQILPAIFLDFGMRLMKTKPFLLKLQRVIYNAQVSLKYYTPRRWEIKNDKYLDLTKVVPDHELNEFGLTEKYKSMVDYVVVCYLGTRRFLLKQKPETIEKSKKKFQKFVILDRLIKVAVFAVILWQALTRFFW